MAWAREERGMSDGPARRGDEADEVREEERFDAERLRPWLEAAFPGERGPITLQQFRKGHSNLTYLVRMGGHQAVLRRAPFGANVKSAHDMGREFRILSALQGHYARAPRPLAACDDASVIGAPFYLMERVEGMILRGDSAASGMVLTPELLHASSTALVDNLVELHAVDLERSGLASMGRPQGYVERQVTGWSERYQRARTEEVPDMEAAAAWLAAHRADPGGAALVHNDYKFDNVVLDPADPSRIVAVLDWEMATVGDPLMDLGVMLGYWVDPDDPDELKLRTYGPTWLPGCLSRLEIVDRYARRSGRAVGPVHYHYVFALFKIAVIVQQIHRRWVDGHTRDPRFAGLGRSVRLLSGQAVRAIELGRIDRLGR
jgi:aminoglycoside phosphotransferase (APT) family kinase protein